MDLRRLIVAIRGWLPLVVASAVLAGGAAFVVSNLLPKTYRAEATLIVGQSLSASDPDYNQLLVSQRLSATYAALATRRPILDAVIEQLGLGVTTEDLAKHVRASAPLDSTLLTIAAEDPDAARAAAIANVLVEHLILASPAIQGREDAFQESLDADLKATQVQIVETQAELRGLRVVDEPTVEQEARIQVLEDRIVSLRSTYATLLSFTEANPASQLQVIEPAVTPLEPASPRPLLNTVLAAVLGLLVAAAIAFGVEYFNDSVQGPEDVQDAVGLSTLGMIGRMNGTRGRSEIYRLTSLLYPRSATAEAYRTLRTNVEFASVGKAIRTLLVTSAMPGEGKTVTAANLAVVFAQDGLRVLLVDADLRKPGIHLIFDRPNDRGLTTLLLNDEGTIDTIAAATEEANLRVVTSGPLPPNPAELLGSLRMQSALDRLAAASDLVVLDGPPLQAVTDSAIMSSYLDATLLVVDAGRSRRRSVRLAREALGRAGANVLGVVLNRYPAHSRLAPVDYYGGYGDTDGEGRGPAPALDPVREPASASARAPETS